MNQGDIDRHVQDDHGKTAFSTYLREIVYGANDGIVTTFAVVAGFAGANSGDVASYSFVSVLLFGLANLFADATSMGLGNFLSGRSERKVYERNRMHEKKEVEEDPIYEKEQTVFLLKKKGFEVQDAQAITDLYAKNKEYWVDFMMTHELGMEDNRDVNPLWEALATFSAFLVFGFVPLAPFVFFADHENAFLLSVFGSLGALLLLAILRWRVTKENLLNSIFEVMSVGIIAGIVAYVVGSFFKG
jgi:vacuolar iron transporter family protein